MMRRADESVRFIRSDKPGVVLVESRSQPGTYYALSGFGTPFPVCSCPGARWGNGECRHTRAARAAAVSDGEALPVGAGS
jgi:hypothetical protein